MSLYTKLVSTVIFPLHEKLKNHTSVSMRREMEEVQWWPKEKILELQLHKLKAFLLDINEHVPYYKTLFSKLAFNPNDVISVKDLERLPLLEKPIIRDHLEELKRDSCGELVRYNTGGSSGIPLVFYIGKGRTSHDVASKWRATRWWGVDIGDPEIVVWGSPIEVDGQDRVKAVRDQLLRSKLLPAFEMNEKTLAGFIKSINDYKPKMIFGYPSALTHIANYALRKGISFKDVGLKVAFVTSEKLYEQQRETIERVFACPVANGYGARDAGFIAHQCPSGEMHITADDIVVEIVDAHGRQLPSGRYGEIVITHLATGDFPFVRYRTGDVGALSDEQCACGRGLPLLKDVQGRTTDFVIAKDGTVMHGLALIYAVRDIPEIEQFKIVQESIELTRLLISPGAGFSDVIKSEIIAKFKARLGEDVEVIVDLVDKIPEEKSGKFRYVVSKVSADNYEV